MRFSLFVRFLGDPAAPAARLSEPSFEFSIDNVEWFTAEAFAEETWQVVEQALRQAVGVPRFLEVAKATPVRLDFVSREGR